MSTLKVNKIEPQSGTTVAVTGTLDVSGTIKSYAFETITTLNTTHEGSNSFGNNSTDVHQFTGSLYISEALGVSGSSAVKALTATTISGSSTLQAVGATTLGSTLAVSGNVGFGVSDPDALLEIFGTSTQLKLSHNANDYATFTLADTGDLTIATVGDGTTDSDLTLDVDGGIKFDAAVGTIGFAQNATEKFTIDLNGTNDAVFKDKDGDEIFRIDESEDSLLMAGTNKLQFRDTAAYINSPTANDLEIAATDIVLDAATLIDLQSDAVSIGEGGDTDVVLTFNANSADGELKWMEDEDYFEFSDDILMATTEKLQLRDTAIYLYSSADGQADLVADSVIQVTAPTVNIEASTAITLESDSVTFGEAGNTDIVLAFNATTSDGELKWMEDEDYFEFSDDILMATTEKLQLRDTAIYLYSSADGQADLVADSVIQVTAPTVNIEASTAITLESDSITLGEGSDTDIVLTFNANTADGVLTWLEDEDVFEFSDKVNIGGINAMGISANTNGLAIKQDTADKQALAVYQTVKSAAATPQVLIYNNAGSNTDPHLRITNAHDSDTPAIMELLNDRATETDDDVLGTIRFSGNNSSNSKHIYATISGSASDVTNNDEGGKLTFEVYAGGIGGTAGPTNLFSIGGEDQANSTPCEVIVNDTGIDCDFRVEGDVETHLFFVDAGNERVSIGDSTDAPAATLEITNHASAGATGVPLLQLNSNDTDKIALDVNAANIDANVIDIAADAVTTANVIDITADGLTTGAALNIATTATNDNAGSLVKIAQAGSRAGSAASVGLDIDFNTVANANARALRIDSEQSTGIVAEINGDGVTTGTAVDISTDARTTGTALNISDSATNDNAGSLVKIAQAGSRAGSAASIGLDIDFNTVANANARAFRIDSEQSTGVVAEINGDEVTTGAVIDVSADKLTTGRALHIQSDSSTTQARELVKIHNKNEASTSATCLYVLQNARQAGDEDDNLLAAVAIEVSGNAGQGMDQTALMLINTATGSNGPIMSFFKEPEGSVADDDYIGTIKFEGLDDGSGDDAEDVVYSRIDVQSIDVSSGAENGNIILTSIVGGSAKEVARTNPESPTANTFMGGFGYVMPVTTGVNGTTLEAKQSGGVFACATNGMTLTLPSSATVGSGIWYTFIWAGAAGQTMNISPNSNDKIMGSIIDVADGNVVTASNNGGGTDDKDLQLDSGSKIGDKVTLVSDGNNGWFIWVGFGSWVFES